MSGLVPIQHVEDAPRDAPIRQMETGLKLLKISEGAFFDPIYSLISCGHDGVLLCLLL